MVCAISRWYEDDRGCSAVQIFNYAFPCIILVLCSVLCKSCIYVWWFRLTWMMISAINGIFFFCEHVVHKGEKTWKLWDCIPHSAITKNVNKIDGSVYPFHSRTSYHAFDLGIHTCFLDVWINSSTRTREDVWINSSTRARRCRGKEGGSHFIYAFIYKSLNLTYLSRLK